MNIYKLTRVLLIFTAALFFGCNQNSSSKKSNEMDNKSLIDTTELFQSLLKYPKVNNILSQYPTDTIYVIKNAWLSSPIKIKVDNKIIVFKDKPKGYPKYDIFDYKKFQISFEQLQIERDTVRCSVLIKTIGVIADFKLIKSDHQWKIINYTEIRI